MEVSTGIVTRPATLTKSPSVDFLEFFGTHKSFQIGEVKTSNSTDMSAPDKGIPGDVLNKAECVVIIPGMKKGGFIVGGRYGKGAVSCRNKAKTAWGAPAMLEMGGGSFGLQIGASEVDVVMLVMDYSHWRVDRTFLLVPAQEYVGKYIATFKEFPPSQKVGSFSLDQVLEKLTAASTSGV